MMFKHISPIVMCVCVCVCRFHVKAIMTAVVVEMKEVYILLAGLSSSPVAHYILGVSYTESCVLHLARYRHL